MMTTPSLKIVNGRHYLYMGSDVDSAEWRRTRAHEEYMQPAILFLATDMSAEDWAMDNSYLKSASWLAAELAPNINIMTVDQASYELSVFCKVLKFPFSFCICVFYRGC